MAAPAVPLRRRGRLAAAEPGGSPEKLWVDPWQFPWPAWMGFGASWASGRCPWLWQGLDSMVFEVPSSPQRSVALRVCDYSKPFSAAETRWVPAHPGVSFLCPQGGSGPLAGVGWGGEWGVWEARV